MIYGRLLKLKTLNKTYMEDPRYGKKTNDVALQLGLYSSKFDGKTRNPDDDDNNE